MKLTPQKTGGMGLLHVTDGATAIGVTVTHKIYC